MRSRSSPEDSGAAAAAECFCLALLNLGRSQIFFVSRDGPRETKRILHLAVAIAPELIGKWERHGAAGSGGFLEDGVGIRHVKIQHHWPISLHDRRAAHL